ncbi:MAG TPA: CvpA family protein [Phycisphaerales bacterium]|nr:CvpA family protein [Phycisphaerales bacterium]
MSILDIIIIILIGLIAYWWANQGFLSGLLHLVCVITAGALALAWWEPIVINNLLSKSWWSGLMPGTMLLGTFLVALVLLRMASDKLAFGNTRLPRPVDMVGGGILGAISGVLTTGLLLIGIGFIDQPQEILGHTGWARNDEGTVNSPDSGLWLPVDTWTVDFFELLSVGTLRPDLSGQPLADWNPDLDRQASLLRDRQAGADQKSFGQMIQPPGSVTISPPWAATISDGGEKAMVVQLDFEASGMDFGKKLALASSQLRLGGSSKGETTVIHPTFWTQQFRPDIARAKRDYQRKVDRKEMTQPEMDRALDKLDDDIKKKPSGKFSGLFEFANKEAYITESDEKTAKIRLLFLIPDDFETRFLQIRGTRFDLDNPELLDDWDTFCDMSGFPPEGTEKYTDPWGGDISSYVDQRGRLPKGRRPQMSDFTPRGNVVIDEESQRIVKANLPGVFYKNTSRGTGKLAVTGYVVLIQDPYSKGDTPKMISDPNRNIVKIEVGPTSNADIGRARLASHVDKNGKITLTDTDGGKYAPRGFEHRDEKETTIAFDVLINTWNDISRPPRRGSEDTFSLIFILPVGVSLDQLTLGNEVIGNFVNIVVEPPSKR